MPIIIRAADTPPESARPKALLDWGRMKLLALLLALLAGPVLAQDRAALPKADKVDPRVELAAKIPGAKPADLRPTPIAGIYELTHGGDISYVSSDAKYIFSGDLYRIAPGGDFPNLSETRRRELRIGMLAAEPESDMLVFQPKDPQYTITVFTDVDCQWCQKLHSQIAEYNKLGMKIRYMSYPRSGPETESWYKAEAVWCSANRNDMLTRAKRGEKLKVAHCPQAPIKRQYELGRELGVRATPAMVMPNGELVPGYLPPKELLEHLKHPES